VSRGELCCGTRQGFAIGARDEGRVAGVEPNGEEAGASMAMRFGLTKKKKGAGPVRWGWVPCGGEGGGVRAAGNDPTRQRLAPVGRRTSRGGGVRSGGPTWKREGGMWASPGTHGQAKEKENGSGPKKQCNFLLNKK
jgi:hypothetical protein